MVRTKARSKQQQKRGIDFKKIKRKLGRKLPPPKNATNTEIKSKAIVLPEQSVAAEKAGLAVSKKGLTLKELLQQTSHHNSKVRKDALMGIKDLFIKHPEELRLHRFAAIEKLRERISDEDKVVRETLYQLFKSVIFPGCNEDNQGPFISLMMTYIFNAMTNLAIDVRLMAFKFSDLVVQYYPPCFSIYAEKILQNFEDILQKNQFYLEDKGKLKHILAGLVRCLALLPSNNQECEKDIAAERMLHAFEPDAVTKSAGIAVISKKLNELVLVLINSFQEFIPVVNSIPQLDGQSFDCILSILQSIDIAVRLFIDGIGNNQPGSKPSQGEIDMILWDQNLFSVLSKRLFSLFPLNPKHQFSLKEDDRKFILNIVIAKIFLHMREWICPPVNLLEKFLEFIEDALVGKIYRGTRSAKAAREKHLLSLLSFIPKIVLEVASDWRSRLLEAFTQRFKDCNPESELKLACLAIIEEMLIIGADTLHLDVNDPILLEYQITWIRELPLLLVLLGDTQPSSSKVVLRLLLHLGQSAYSNPALAWEYEYIQNSLCEYYSTIQEGDIYYGPFIKLPRDSQELSICCLYFFSNLNPLLLESIASCCLCPELEPFVLFRIIEVLQCAYKAGHIQIADHISLFITLLSRFKVFCANIYPSIESDVKTENCEAFKSLTSAICSSLSCMGDRSVVLQILEKAILDQISLKPPLQNACAMLRVLVMLDSKPTRLSESSIIALSNFLPRYLIDVGYCIPETDDEVGVSNPIDTCQYYLIPCYFLFDRSHKLLNLVLRKMGLTIIESNSSVPSHDSTQYSSYRLSQINAIVSVLISMDKDVKVQKVICLFRTEIEHIIHNMESLQSSEEFKMTIEERHKLQSSLNRLRTLTSMSQVG